jgi:hypothetical protein
VFASGTPVSPRNGTLDPLLHSTFEELKIDLDMAHLFALVDLLASARGAPFDF